MLIGMHGACNLPCGCSLDITAIPGNWSHARSDERDAVYAHMHTQMSQIAARQLFGERSGDVLLDHARRRLAQKRDGGIQVQLTLAAGEGAAVATSAFLLEDALTQLSAIEPLHAPVVEMRFYGGLTIEEAAEALGVSPRTVKRAWTAARAWMSWYIEQER